MWGSFIMMRGWCRNVWILKSHENLYDYFALIGLHIGQRNKRVFKEIYFKNPKHHRIAVMVLVYAPFGAARFFIISLRA